MHYQILSLIINLYDIILILDVLNLVQKGSQRATVLD